MGAPPGFAEFCRREHGRLTGVLSFYTGDPAVAEELAQEALVRAWSHWPRVRRLDAPGGWVYRVALNLAASHGRRKAAERRALARHGTPSCGTGPDLADAVAVRLAVAHLPERQRGALVLRYFADLSVRDTAVALGVSEGAVKALTNRAVAALRVALGETSRSLNEELHHD